MNPHNMTDEELLREARDSMDPMIRELAERFSGLLYAPIEDDFKEEIYQEGYEQGWEAGYVEGLDNA